MTTQTINIGNDLSPDADGPTDALDVNSDSDSLNLSDIASPFASNENVAFERARPPGNLQGSGFGAQAIPRLNTPDDLGKGVIKTNTNKSNEYTILLIGETGTGKTSLLSLISNVLAGRSPNAYDLAHDESNEAGGIKNQSQTNLAKLYEFKSINGVKIRILDTPGLADTRGLAQDELHKASIANVIKEHITVVNAVIILSNGTVERLGVATDYALSTLSSMFPRTLAANIGILFTNVPNRLSWNFDQNSLPSILRSWEHCNKRGIRKNQFLVDNPVALWKKLVHLRSQGWSSDCELNEFECIVNNDHAKALRELSFLFDWLDALVPQPTNDIINLYEQYQEIETQITNALARASQLRDLKAELKGLKESAAGSSFTMKQYENIRKTSDKQVWEQVNSQTLNQMCDHPKCYSNCYDWSGFSIVFRIKLFVQHFQGFRVPFRPCQKCGHPYDDHRTHRSRWKQRDYRPEIVNKDDKEAKEAKENNDKHRTKIIDFDKSIANLDKDMEEALVALGRLTESYGNLSLTGSFAGQIKKSIRLLEMHLTAAQQHTEADLKSIDVIKKSLENMKRKLKMVAEARKKAGTNDNRIIKFGQNARKYTNRSFSLLLSGDNTNKGPYSSAQSLDRLVHMGI